MFECHRVTTSKLQATFILMQKKKNASLMACVYFNNFEGRRKHCELVTPFVNLYLLGSRLEQEYALCVQFQN